MTNRRARKIAGGAVSLLALAVVLIAIRPRDPVIPEGGRGNQFVREDKSGLQASNSVATKADARASHLSSQPALRKNAAAESLARLQALAECERDDESAPCASLLNGVEDETPSSASERLSDQIISELAFLKALAEQEAHSVSGPSFSFLEIAEKYVRHSDDNVREQALNLASLAAETIPSRVLDVAVEALSTTVSGPLAEQALELMQRTQGSNPVRVEATLLKTLETGGWDVRDAIAENLLPFLNSANRSKFEKILEQAAPRSKLALHMRLNLEEFDRMERL